MESKFCGKCDRDLAATYDNCPFCGGDLETRVVLEQVEDEGTKNRRIEEAIRQRREHKKRLKLMAILFVASILLTTGYVSRVADSPLTRSGEWYAYRSYESTFEKPNNEAKLPTVGVISSDAEFNAFRDRFEPPAKSPFQKIRGLSFPVEAPDFTKTCLVYLATQVALSDGGAPYIEEVTENFRTHWLLRAWGPKTEDLGRALEKSTGNWRVQFVHIVAVAPPFTAPPTVEDISEPFSRLKPAE